MPLLMAVAGIGFVLSYDRRRDRRYRPLRLAQETLWLHRPMPPRQPVRRSRSPRHADQAATKVPALGRGAGLPCRLVLPPARACLSGFSRPAGKCRLAWAHQPRMSAKPRPRRRPGRGARGPRGTVRGTVSVTLGNGPWNGLAANGPCRGSAAAATSSAACRTGAVTGAECSSSGPLQGRCSSRRQCARGRRRGGRSRHYRYTPAHPRKKSRSWAHRVGRGRMH
jgi:hypothetical protein